MTMNNSFGTQASEIDPNCPMLIEWKAGTRNNLVDKKDGGHVTTSNRTLSSRKLQRNWVSMPDIDTMLSAEHDSILAHRSSRMIQERFSSSTALPAPGKFSKALSSPSRMLRVSSAVDSCNSHTWCCSTDDFADQVRTPLFVTAIIISQIHLMLV